MRASESDGTTTAPTTAPSTPASDVVDLRTSFAARAEQRLDDVTTTGRYRRTIPLDGTGVHRTLLDGTAVVSFASNDYLGFSTQPDVIAAAADASHRYGAGAGASRLVVGSLPIHHELEAFLAAWKNTRTASLFSTGYSANIGVIGAVAQLVDPTVGTFICDELNHASLIDAVRLSGLNRIIVPHNDVEAYRSALASVPRGAAIVVTDSVFSMDGDRAPVAELDSLCAENGALLVLDEAHETWPVAPPTRCETVRIGTLSKMLGSLGGYCVGPEWLNELIVNTSRPYIFSTAPTPAACGAALAALSLLSRDEGLSRLDALQSNVDAVRPGHTTPIVPIVIGDETAAVEASLQLRDQGVLVPAIRPPSVPTGTSRLRVALNADHRQADIERLTDALESLTTP